MKMGEKKKKNRGKYRGGNGVENNNNKALDNENLENKKYQIQTFGLRSFNNNFFYIQKYLVL